MPVTLPTLSISRHLASRLTNNTNPAQQIVNTFIKCLCRVVPTHEMLNVQKQREAENPHMKEMREHGNLLNNLYHEEMRQQNSKPVGVSCLTDIIGAQICAVNSKYHTGGYHLSFNYNDGVTMHAIRPFKAAAHTPVER